MTQLPDRKEALANLRRTGYVRLGDHSATSFEALNAIYDERSPAWLQAEKEGFAPTGATDVFRSGLVSQPSTRLPAVLDWPSEPSAEAKPSDRAGKTPKAKADGGAALAVDLNSAE